MARLKGMIYQSCTGQQQRQWKICLQDGERSIYLPLDITGSREEME